MTSSAQLAANRRNAKKSTGPKTAEGKAVAARNALRHGLTARQIVCYTERESDFAAFQAAMRAALDPADEVEEQMAERVILLGWRLRRTARAERGVIDCDPDPSPELTFKETLISRAFIRRGDSMITLSRYEAGLDRAFGRAYAMLERRQAARRGEHVPAPVTVLVEGVDAAPPNHPPNNDKNENYQTKPISAVAVDDDAAR